MKKYGTRRLGSEFELRSTRGAFAAWGAPLVRCTTQPGS